MLIVDNLLDLPIDIKVQIASYFEHIWILFALYDRKFYEYTRRYKAKFIELFAIYTDKYPQYGTSKLFGKLNSIHDRPARIICPGEDYWYKNDKLHRKTRRNNSTLPAVDRYRLPDFISYTFIYNNDLTITNVHQCFIVGLTEYHAQQWFQNGYYCREKNLPTVNEHIGDLQVQLVIHSRFKLHNKRGPAIIASIDDKVEHIHYFRNQIHNYDQTSPARIVYNGGKIVKQAWYKYGVLIREEINC